MAESHTDDLRNVNENDHVTITTSEGETFDAHCKMRQTQNADPRSGEVRETKLWIFETPHGELAASILDGLKSSPDDPDFPQHSELYNSEEGENYGYVESVQIHGPRLES
jgi:hypothetical protein